MIIYRGTCFKYEADTNILKSLCLIYIRRGQRKPSPDTMHQMSSRGTTKGTPLLCIYITPSLCIVLLHLSFDHFSTPRPFPFFFSSSSSVRRRKRKDAKVIWSSVALRVERNRFSPSVIIIWSGILSWISSRHLLSSTLLLLGWVCRGGS